MEEVRAVTEGLEGEGETVKDLTWTGKAGRVWESSGEHCSVARLVWLVWLAWLAQLAWHREAAWAHSLSWGGDWE